MGIVKCWNCNRHIEYANPPYCSECDGGTGPSPRVDIQMTAVHAERGTHYGMAELKTDGRLYYKGRLAATNVKDLIEWFATNRPHIKLKAYTPPSVTEYCF